MRLDHLSRRARTGSGCTAQDAPSSGELRGPCCRAPNPVGECRYPCHHSGRNDAAGMRNRGCARGGTNASKEVGIPPALTCRAAELAAPAISGLLHESFFGRARRCMRALQMRAQGRTSQSKRQSCTWSALCGRGRGSGLLLSVVRAVPSPSQLLTESL